MKNSPSYDWAVIGAGPAGILAVGKLLDAGVAPSSILWIDPEFQVGDLGTKWSHVASNTNVCLFLKTLHSCASFMYQDAPIDFAINRLPADEPCELTHIVEPLRWISDHLKQKVNARTEHIATLKQDQGRWCLTTAQQTCFYAHKVILATGAEPIVQPSTTPVIPIEAAMDRTLLKAYCEPNDVIGVLGSSHSAIVALYHLMDLKAFHVINFYRSPLRYAVDMGRYILNDNTGLRGYAATWAKTYLGSALPENLERVYIQAPEYEVKRQSCTKIIQAIGFKQRALPKILPYEDLPYNPITGILAPGLFGTGFAYPLIAYAKPGLGEHAIGLWDFVMQLDEVLPLWLCYPV
jgi:cation diffusion facilitator CzcD-associated flavoprotein CzcO